MKSKRNKAFWWISATGNRPRGKIRKATVDQYVQWTKNWEAYDKAPKCYQLTDDRRLVACMDGRSFRRLLWDIRHHFGSPRHFLDSHDTLYYDHEEA